MTAGQSLAQFEILEALGEGEFGAVYKAHDAAAAREVALEVLPGARAFDIDRLRQEVKAAARIEHWNIAKVYELGRAGDVNFLVREHVPGRTLAEAEALDPAAALDCARQIAGALAAAHSIGVTHRHLNPANVVLAGGGRVQLLNAGLTPPGRDPAYLAPEQMDGRGADARADIYAFGRLLQKIYGPSAPAPVAQIVARATRKDAARRYQLMDDVRAALEKLADPAAHPPDPNRRLLVGIAAGVAVAAALGWWMLGGRESVHRAPVRITSDSGLTTEGVLSPDGRMLAYASDRGSEGVLHLWVQPLSGGPAARLTDGAEDDHQPAFAPDGSRLVFRSERDGGGLYTIAAAGGALQLLMKEGRNPRYSPDGRWIAYWSGDPLAPDDGAVWVIASSGGAPVRIQPDFADARHPVWSPDGKRVLFAGRAADGRRGWGGDWYAAPFDNGSAQGQATRTGAETLLHMQDFRESGDVFYSRAFIVPDAWTPGEVLFSGRLQRLGRDANTSMPHLMRIPLAGPLLQAGGAAHEITPGPEWDAYPSAASNGRIAYTRRTLKAQIRDMRADGSGDLLRAAPDEGEVRFSVSADGKRLAYRHQAAAASEFHIVDLDTGRIAASLRQPDAANESVPVLSADGQALAYAGRGIVRVRLPAGEEERIARRPGRLASWSADGKFMLLERGRRGVALLNVETGQEREFLRDDAWSIVDASFSPDSKRVVFTVLSRPDAQIFVAEVDTPEQRTAVSPDRVSAVAPAWAPDGRRIYFVTRCQGFRCIWARRFEPRQKQPAGDAFPVRHFHHARHSLVSAVEPRNISLAAAGGKLLVGLFETTGNVWTLAALPRP